jgi:hypothetical protein
VRLTGKIEGAQDPVLGLKLGRCSSVPIEVRLILGITCWERTFICLNDDDRLLVA